MTTWAERYGSGTVNPIEMLPTLAGFLENAAASGAGDAYNWKADNTRRLTRSLRQAVAGTGSSEHLVIGDWSSTMFGQSADSGGSIDGTLGDNWPAVMQARLESAGVPGSGGWVKVARYYPTGKVDSRITLSGSWTHRNDYLESTSSGNTVTLVSDRIGTAVSVAYFNTSGEFTVTIDGGSPVTVTPSGGPTMGFYTVTGLSNTVHTVVISTTTTDTTFVTALSVYTPNTLQVHNFATAATGSSGFTGSAFPTLGWIAENIVTDPDVVHIALGFNDQYSSVPIATTVANLTTIRNKWPSADAILYAQYQASDQANWGSFVTALYDLADTLDCPLVDMFARSGGYAVAGPDGLMTSRGAPGGTYYYPSIAGSLDWGLVTASNMEILSSSAPTTKQVVSLNTSATLLSVANREYIYLLGSSAVPTLPTAVGNASIYHLKATAGPVTVATTSSQTIDGGAGSLQINLNECYTLVSNGSNWVVI